MQNVGLGQDSAVKAPVPVSTMDGLLQVPLARTSALPEWSTATQDVLVAQEIATRSPAESVATLCQPPGGVDDRMAPVLSTASHTVAVGQDIPLMVALPCKGVTGNGLLHPDEPDGWAGVAAAVPGDAAGVPDESGLAEVTGAGGIAGRAGEVI